MIEQQLPEIQKGQLVTDLWLRAYALPHQLEAEQAAAVQATQESIESLSQHIGNVMVNHRLYGSELDEDLLATSAGMLAKVAYRGFRAFTLQAAAEQVPGKMPEVKDKLTDLLGKMHVTVMPRDGFPAEQIIKLVDSNDTPVPSDVRVPSRLGGRFCDIDPSAGHLWLRPNGGTNSRWRVSVFGMYDGRPQQTAELRVRQPRPEDQGARPVLRGPSR